MPLTGRRFNTVNVITDRDGNIFFTNADGLIYCISGRSGLLFTISGNCSATLGINSFAGDGGLATLASFNNPTGLVFDAAGNLYIADKGNNRVRRINLVTGIVTTIAGGGASTADNIQGTTALLTAPRSLAFGPDGLLYIAGGANRIRRLNVVSGMLSFFAGTGVGVTVVITGQPYLPCLATFATSPSTSKVICSSWIAVTIAFAASTVQVLCCRFLGLRALYFALAAMIHRFRYLKYALALVFIGAKIFLVGIMGKIPPSISLSVTFELIAGGVLILLYKTRDDKPTLPMG